ncbi:MAG TPA: pyridoxal phosphate-dependent aminotransferase [Kofleriaceae bacterium]|nr:pyridoxal phosphate-dependent aminotransferase [Kofleriaceae bacterium]
MARFPDVSTAGTAVPASIFARLREHVTRFTAAGGDLIPLQIGDTHLPPAARLEELAWTELAPTDLYAYGSPAGWAPLLEALAAKAIERNEIPATPAGIQIACGATHALSCAVQALCDPGDDLILLTPHWPLIKGMARGFGVTPVELPFADDLAAVLEPAITPRTSAIYFATPNNPDGVMLTRAQLEQIAAVAARHGLWILADEVYEDYGYDAEHVSIASLPGAAERTVTVYSFAKSYAQAGLRVGYAVTTDAVAATLRKLVNHSVYNVPVAMQRAALGALTHGAYFLATAREQYLAQRDRARALLRAPAACPPGGAYLWVDFRNWSGDDCMPILEQCAASGVLLAPGNAFGDACGGFARLCFTGVPSERLEEGIDRINRVLVQSAP